MRRLYPLGEEGQHRQGRPRRRQGEGPRRREAPWTRREHWWTIIQSTCSSNQTKFQ